jgi:hypothetical protein
MSIAEIVPMPITVPLQCSRCGAEGTGSCRCNAPYMQAAKRAAPALAAHPEKSDRAIAREIGVSHVTVGKVRKATGKEVPVRTGRDGIARKTPKRKPVGSTTTQQTINAFLGEIGEVVPEYVERLERWFDSEVVIDSEGRQALVHMLESMSWQLQMLAQKIDGR